MVYIVIEIQTNADGTVGNIVTKYDNLPEAEAKWHSILAFAATSTLPVHSAVILDSDGMTMAQRSYRHKQEANNEE